MTRTNCPNCGAAAELEAGSCPACGAELVLRVEATREAGGPVAAPRRAVPADGTGGAPGAPNDPLAGSSLGRLFFRNGPAELAWYLGWAALVPGLGLLAVIPAVILGVRGLCLWQSDRRLGGLGRALAGLGLALFSAGVHLAFASAFLRWLLG